MEAKLIKKNGKCYVQLPDSFANLDEVELFQLKENFWLLSAPLGTKPAAKPTAESKTLTDAEKSVLQKLTKIRFADRTPSNIEKAFSPAEQETVRQLIKKGALQVFYGKKYEKTGVYNISDDVYPHISHGEIKQSAEPKTQKSQHLPPAARHAIPTYSQLSAAGWLVISNPRDAEQFTLDLKKAGLSQNVKGVRGFDGKFYVATTKFFYAAQQKIRTVMEKKKSGMLVEEIAVEASIEPEAAGVALRILAESGEAIEKKRGLFCLA